MATPEVRVVAVRPRTILLVLGIAVLVGLALALVYLAWRPLTWIIIAMLLAAALNPAVEAIERRGLARPWAASLVFVTALLVVTGIGFLVIPPLVTQVTDFGDAVPDFIDDLTAGEGPLGWLQDEYQIVDRIRAAIEEQGVGVAHGRRGRGGGGRGAHWQASQLSGFSREHASASSSVGVEGAGAAWLTVACWIRVAGRERR